MEKLELKHIQHYPMGRESALRCIYKEKNILGRIIGFKVFTLSDPLIYVQTVEDTYSLYLDEISPILRPMSDLYKPLEDGSIPIVELAKIGSGNKDIIFRHEVNGNEYYKYKGNKDYKGKLYYFSNSGKVDVSYIENYNCLSLFLNNSENDEWSRELLVNQLEIYEYLFKHHFDVYGLIKKGLAIDIKTIQD